MARWTRYSDIELQNLFFERKGIEEISKIMRRHPASIRERIDELDLRNKRAKADNVPSWTAYEDKKILEGVDNKISAAHIAAQIGRHKDAVIARIKVLMS